MKDFWGDPVLPEAFSILAVIAGLTIIAIIQTYYYIAG